MASRRAPSGVVSARAAAWEAFWHGPESPRNLAAARVLLAAVALWIILSRPDLPSILDFPPELWEGVTIARRIRYFFLFPLAVERGLYLLLHASLLAALFGVAPRVSCFASGLLLYHFAPLECLIRVPDPYLRGLTFPTLGLLILSFAPAGTAPRWPLRLIQVLLVQMYLFAGYSKLVTTGLAWADADNIRNHMLILNQLLTRPPDGSWGYAVAGSTVLCSIIAWGGLAFELAFPAVLFSSGARKVLVPVALAFHAANAVLFRVFFQGSLLVLLFVDWDRLSRRGET